MRPTLRPVLSLPGRRWPVLSALALVLCQDLWPALSLDSWTPCLSLAQLSSGLAVACPVLSLWPALSLPVDGPGLALRPTGPAACPVLGQAGQWPTCLAVLSLSLASGLSLSLASALSLSLASALSLSLASGLSLLSCSCPAACDVLALRPALSLPFGLPPCLRLGPSGCQAVLLSHSRSTWPRHVIYCDIGEVLCT